ncbi:MAG TPA: c-type cytochrome, partial [Stellaceae bacterium]|nr:c-type cytochrome [Stellaceae bacterium]
VPLMLGMATIGLSTAHAESLVERGKYLASFSGCDHCHTPGYFLGKPDAAREFSGSDVGFKVGDLGIFVGPNLTSDKETGLGAWTDEQIATVLTTGERPDGRILAPIMPWRSFAKMTKPDVAALVAYLRNLPPINHRVLGPFGPDEKPPIFVMRLTPPEGMAAK